MSIRKAVSRFFYRIIYGILWLFYPKIKLYGAQSLPKDPAIIVANHCQLHGPIACELHLNIPREIWCTGEMMRLRDVPAYAYRDFWSQKGALSRPFYRLLSYIIAPLSVVIFNNAHTIGVYHDARILSTFKETVASLQNGENVVIFPEYDALHNSIIYDFREKFIDVARLYHKKSGKAVSFVPMYIAPKLKGMYMGASVTFDPDAPIDEERRRIRDHLMNEITHTAVNLPEHTVVPYRNIPKRFYPKNTQEVKNDASARG